MRAVLLLGTVLMLSTGERASCAATRITVVQALGRVQGRIDCSPSKGEPVEVAPPDFATLRLFPLDGPSAAETVEHRIPFGAFDVPAAKGTWWVEIHVDGFAPWSEEARVLARGASADLGPIHLERGATLEGTVTGPDGPRADVTVYALAPAPRRGAPAILRETRTNAQGVFAFEHLSPVSQEVWAIDLALALTPPTSIRLANEERSSIELRLEENGSLSLVVVGADGEPVPGVLVTRFQGGRPPRDGSWGAEDPTFTTESPPLPPWCRLGLPGARSDALRMNRPLEGDRITFDHLPSGPHTVWIRAPGYRRVVEEVVLSEGARETVFVPMKKGHDYWVDHLTPIERKLDRSFWDPEGPEATLDQYFQRCTPGSFGILERNEDLDLAVLRAGGDPEIVRLLNGLEPNAELQPGSVLALSFRHRVLPGETWSDLADLYQTSTDVLRRLNPRIEAEPATWTAVQVPVKLDGDPDDFRLRRVLPRLRSDPRQSAFRWGTARAVVHTVTADDTRERLASQQGLPLGEVPNPLVSPDRWFVEVGVATHPDATVIQIVQALEWVLHVDLERVLQWNGLGAPEEMVPGERLRLPPCSVWRIVGSDLFGSVDYGGGDVWEFTVPNAVEESRSR